MDPTRLSPTTEERPPYRPPAGLPLERQSSWATPVSLALHLLLILALLIPSLVAKTVLDIPVGAGGPGARGGGGGGGRGGSGGAVPLQERLQYVEVAPPPTPLPAVVPPVVAPVPPPVITPPPAKPEVKPTPKLETPAVELKAEPLKAELPVAAVGTGGGTGNDGTNGTGPGSGGGVGSGVGTGRGSGTGPGAGGGDGTVYPPSPTFMPIPPFPVPDKLKGQAIALRFSVNERGEVLKLDFDGTGDGSYNRRIRDQFNAVRFRPAVRSDGTPVAALTVITLHL